MRKSLLTLFALAAAVAAPAALSAHCQIPCGIYGDEGRFASMLEDVTTIEKSITEINRLSAEGKPDWNQLVRWVMNKEDHAAKLTETVTYYFLAQRIKPAGADMEAEHAKYLSELQLLHQIVVQAMKAKQATDPAVGERLRGLIGEFKTSYLGEHEH